MDMEDPPPSATPSARSSPGVLTPPDTPLSSFATPAINGQPPSPTSAVSAFDTKTFLRRGAPNGANGSQPTPNRLTLNLSFPSHNQGSHPGTPLSPHVDPFNTYGRYAGEYSNDNSSGSTTAVEECVPPALLFSTNASPESTPSTSRLPSPQAPPSDASAVPPTKASPPSSAAPKALKVTVPPPQATNNQDPLRPTPASLGRPTASLLLSKPFKCPRPNCNKSYKQANGLKYHMTHGTCNFAPPKDLEQVQALLERKRRDRAAAVAAGQIEEGPADSGVPNNSPYGEITDAELREVEREAERRLRPFACGVGDCTRRYKNMNGLRYHYQHSGEHGAIGLAMLASGVHECLNNSGHGRESSAARAEREGRKRASNKSSPTSRATSLSRVDSAPATPTTATGPARPAYAPPPVQYSTQVSYQQRYADHQRPPFQQQPPPPPPPHYAPPPLEAYQPPQQPQYASMMYTPNSVGVDVGMVG
ncbi:hypothetical protein CYLTODRAFT_199689 [Cylindrobasidium torrendii FP15055 ss-10]|uniref:C2H2-type domain-containing protein n=1 Tax=Cylindrobasidium torrendii FP15055 ss-10 TaxID=1314674 RepID=A0A0D7AVP8_9AGAR|nr:hypothetical protein CYLTODRAFT_199689 [Cylindrobasidium torrendii FP15055 ss-10]